MTYQVAIEETAVNTFFNNGPLKQVNETHVKICLGISNGSDRGGGGMFQIRGFMHIRN